MSPNEEFVMKSLTAVVGGKFEDGDDPPDAILHLDAMRIGVEVSSLVQQVVSDSGVTVSRISLDAPALKFANDLNDEMASEMPEDKHILVIVPAPLNNVRKTKKEVRGEILDRIALGKSEGDIEVQGNKISIRIYEGTRPSGKKVIGAVATRTDSTNIGLNAEKFLKDRINAKSEKYSNNGSLDEYWLALFNDYWLADFTTYELAYKSSSIQHPFERIYIVNGGGEVHLLGYKYV